MRFRIDDEPLFWCAVVFIALPLLVCTFIRKENIALYQRIIIRLFFALILYIVYVYYVVQDGSSFGGN